MDRLTSWTAKRAGGRITITGLDAAGKPVKIVGVDMIQAQYLHPVAVDRSGKHYELISSAARAS